jgi:hypothetical protein
MASLQLPSYLASRIPLAAQSCRESWNTIAVDTPHAQNQLKCKIHSWPGNPGPQPPARCPLVHYDAGLLVSGQQKKWAMGSLQGGHRRVRKNLEP